MPSRPPRARAAQAGIANWHALGASSLTYVINEKGNAFLAWMTRVEYVNAQGPQIDKVFADATTRRSRPDRA